MLQLQLRLPACDPWFEGTGLYQETLSSMERNTSGARREGLVLLTYVSGFTFFFFFFHQILKSARLTAF
jgi:hypothetical protein